MYGTGIHAAPPPNLPVRVFFCTVFHLLILFRNLFPARSLQPRYVARLHGTSSRKQVL